MSSGLGIRSTDRTGAALAVGKGGMETPFPPSSFSFPAQLGHSVQQWSESCEGLLTCSALGLLIAADFHCRSLSVRKRQGPGLRGDLC